MPELDSALDDVRARQLASWEAGERTLLESFLAEAPAGLRDDDHPDALLDLIYAEVLLREEFGERPTVEEYVGRFPTHEAAIRRQFTLHEAIGVLGGVGGASSPPEAATQTAPSEQQQQDRRHPRVFVRREIGPYEILDELGRGGMGVVYRCRHRTTGRIAAVKVLRGDGAEEEDRERFLTEARAMASLRHENVVSVFEVSGPGAEEPYVALEHAEGGSLDRALAGTPMPPPDAAALLLPLADAVAYAHSRGVIHRDLKPANVLLLTYPVAVVPDPSTPAPTSGEKGGRQTTKMGTPKLTDFGLARRLADVSRTRTGAILGTPSYLAPEQAMGLNDQVGPAADVYGLGATLYEMLAGRPPFKADTVMNTLAQVIDQDVVPPRSLQPGVPRDLETICLKCLHKVPAQRYASAGEVAADLRRFLRGEPIRARAVGVIERAARWVRRRPAAALLIGVSVAALVGLIWFTFQLDAQRREAEHQKGIAETKSREARRQAEIADKERIEAQAQNKRASYLLALSANAVDEIAINVRHGKATEKATGNTGSVLFELARFYARTSKTIAGDQDLVAEDRVRLADQYAVSAMRLLVCAQEVGFFERSKPENRRKLQTDADLSVLRSRADYRRWAAGLP